MVINIDNIILVMAMLQGTGIQSQYINTEREEGVVGVVNTGGSFVCSSDRQPQPQPQPQLPGPRPVPSPGDTDQTRARTRTGPGLGLEQGPV